MDFMHILKEAKDPKGKVTVSERDTNNVTDYSAQVEDEPEDETPDTEETTDDTTTEEETDDTASEDETEEDAPTDYTTDDTGSEEDEPTDYTEDVTEETPDEANADTSEEDNYSSSDDSTSSDDPNDESNKALLKDFINLHEHIMTNVAKFDNVKSIDMVTSIAISKVKDNLSQLTDYIYTYIRTKFKTKTYAENLYTYKYIIQLYKICVQMLSKINNFSGNT